MAKRPDADAWDAARLRWESDPTETFESIGKSLGVSKQAVSMRAAKGGWERAPSLRSVVERAQFKADRQELDAKLDGQVDPTSGKREAARREAAEDVRANVLVRHRRDWEEHRRLFNLDSIATDFENGKKAKISAEMLTIRQKGERSAYGLDEPDARAASGGFDALVAAVAAEVGA